jgi:cytochrome c-type biogenesis protein CcmE
MSHIRVKLLVAGLAVTAAVALLAMAGVREGWVYYLPVDEFTTGADYHTQRVRLHGVVATENLEVNEGLLLASFDLLGEQSRVRVSYSGVIPDMFQADREVVVEGRLDGDVFHADTLMTKCASKYESGEGEAPHADPRAGESSS